jgi:hypothetical protein
MPKLKDIEREIQEQHEQLAFNRFKVNLLRSELARSLHETLHSRAALVTAFAAGLLVGWRTWVRPPQSGVSPLAGRLQSLGHWLAPVKGALWSGLIRTVTSYTSGRFAEGLHEYHDR